jgi:hypothetical protein
MRLGPVTREERSRTGVVAEAIVCALAGGALGGLAGAVVNPTASVVLGSIAALNGAVSGWRGIYAWRRRDGWLAFVLDSTWATPPVAIGLIAHAGALMSGNPGSVPELTLRQNRHVYRRGVQLKPGFAFTIGNVISGAGNVDSPRRRRLITDHEDVHVWQSRWFGPAYPVLYVGWSIGGVLAGTTIWLARRRRQPIGKVIESCSYYTNPFEWWAYSRDALWPPPGRLHDVGWRSAAVRPLSTLRRRADRATPGATVDDCLDGGE